MVTLMGTQSDGELQSLRLCSIEELSQAFIHTKENIQDDDRSGADKGIPDDCDELVYIARTYQVPREAP